MSEYLHTELMNAKVWLDRTHASQLDLAIGPIERLIDLLTIRHSALNRRVLVAIDNAIDTHLDKDNNELF